MGMLRAIWNQVRLTWRLVRDPRVPLWAKAIPFIAIAYVLSPLDLIPDVIIGLGQLDDLGVVLAGMRLMEMFVPEYIVAEHRSALTRADRPMEVVDAPKYKISREGEKNKR